MNSISAGGHTTDLSTGVTGTLPVANGGTGAATLTVNNVLLGNGTSALQAIAPGTTGNILTSDGTTWTSAAAPASGVTSIATIGNSSTADGASISGSTLTLTPADGTNGGIVTNSWQTFSGNKTFASDLTINSVVIGLGGGSQENNTDVGFHGLQNNTTGNNVTAIGSISLFNNTTGGDNTAIGNGSLYTNTTGYKNTALGSLANVATNDLTNTTAIGYNATARASNTIQLGDSYITNVITSGALTAGAVTYPNNDGTLGQVLTANANGLPTWQSVSAGTVNLTSGVMGTLPVANGGTGVTTSTGTGNVVLSATPTFTGTPLAPTASAGTNTTQLATTAFVTTAVAAAVRDVTDEFTATAAQITFTLTQTPSANSKVKMYVNGIRISNSAYSISGTTLTYVPASNGAYALSVSDRIQCDYFY